MFSIIWHFFDEVPSLKLKEAQRLLDEAMEFGGFPELVTLKEQKEKSFWIQY